MLVRNTAANIGSLMGGFVLAFLTTGLLAKHLEPTAFGLLALVRAIVGNVGLLETLFGSGVTRHVADAHARGDLARRGDFVGAGLVVNLAQGIALSLVAIVLAVLFFDRVFIGLRAPLRTEGLALLCIFFIVLVVQICSTTLCRALEGLQAYPSIRAIDTVTQGVIFGGLAVYVGLFPGAALSGIAWVYLVAETLRLTAFAVLLRRCGVWPVMRPARLTRGTFRLLFAYGKPVFVAKMFTTLGYRGDVLLIGIFLSVEAAADYQVANQIWSAALTVLSALTAALLPAISERATQASSVELEKLYLRASRYVLAAALCLATVLVVARGPLIRHWVGDSYQGASLLIVLFMVQMMVAYHQGVSGIVALATATHHRMGRLEAFANALNLVLSLLLIQQFGAGGVVFAGIVKTCIVVPGYVNMALRTLSMNWWTFARECILPVWRFFGGLALVGFVLTHLPYPPGIGDTSLVVVQAVVLFAVMAGLGWLVVLTGEDKRRLLRAVVR